MMTPPSPPWNERRSLFAAHRSTSDEVSFSTILNSPGPSLVAPTPVSNPTPPSPLSHVLNPNVTEIQSNKLVFGNHRKQLFPEKLTPIVIDSSDACNVPENTQPSPQPQTQVRKDSTSETSRHHYSRGGIVSRIQKRASMMFSRPESTSAAFSWMKDLYLEIEKENPEPAAFFNWANFLLAGHEFCPKSEPEALKFYQKAVVSLLEKEKGKTSFSQKIQMVLRNWVKIIEEQQDISQDSKLRALTLMHKNLIVNTRDKKSMLYVASLYSYGQCPDLTPYFPVDSSPEKQKAMAVVYYMDLTGGEEEFLQQQVNGKSSCSEKTPEEIEEIEAEKLIYIRAKLALIIFAAKLDPSIYSAESRQFKIDLQKFHDWISILGRSSRIIDDKKISTEIIYWRGYIYYYGTLATKDLYLAKHYLTLAKDKGHEEAALLLSVVNKELENKEANIPVVAMENLLIEQNSQLGTGGFATVYKAALKQGEVKTSVAVKKICYTHAYGIQLSKTEQEDVISEVKKEAFCWSTLHHNNIITLFGLAQESLGQQINPAHFYIVMELASCNLYEFLSSLCPNTTINTKVFISIELVKAVEYIHSLLLVHRDIKARNVLLSLSDNNKDIVSVKLSDFGTTRQQSGKNKTLARPMEGTKTHAPPEVYVYDAPCTYASDVFSFSITLWEIFTNCSLDPYPGYNEMGLSKAMLEGVRPQIPAYTPPEISEIIKAGWFTKPELRINIGKARERLEEFAATLNNSPT